MKNSNPQIIIDSTTTEADLYSIIDLQQKNLAKNISQKEAFEQGFTFVEYDFNLLKRICDAEPAIVARENNKLIGYAIILTRAFGSQIPELAPMFTLFDTLPYEKQKFGNASYVLIGQICIAKEFRGRGIFDQLYNQIIASLSSRFEYLITEVAVRNTRSMNAHQRVGYNVFHSYEDIGEKWNTLILKM